MLPKINSHSAGRGAPSSSVLRHHPIIAVRLPCMVTVRARPQSFIASGFLWAVISPCSAYALAYGFGIRLSKILSCYLYNSKDQARSQGFSVCFFKNLKLFFDARSLGRQGVEGLEEERENISFRYSSFFDDTVQNSRPWAGARGWVECSLDCAWCGCSRRA